MPERFQTKLRKAENSMMPPRWKRKIRAIVAVH
jgi:hypothetical protein